MRQSNIYFGDTRFGNLLWGAIDGAFVGRNSQPFRGARIWKDAHTGAGKCGIVS